MDDELLTRLEAEAGEEEQKFTQKEITQEEKEKLQAVHMDDELLASKDGTVHTVDEIDYIIKDITRHQCEAFRWEETKPELE